MLVPRKTLTPIIVDPPRPQSDVSSLVNDLVNEQVNDLVNDLVNLPAHPGSGTVALAGDAVGRERIA